MLFLDTVFDDFGINLMFMESFVLGLKGCQLTLHVCDMLSCITYHRLHTSHQIHECTFL